METDPAGVLPGLLQLLEAERLLGVRDLPLTAPAWLGARPAGPAAPHVAAARPANSVVGPRNFAPAPPVPPRPSLSRTASAPPAPRRDAPGHPAAPRAPVPAVDPNDERAVALRVLDDTQVKPCTKCGLSRSRTQTVFGQGDPHARLVFVGEAPGFEEDQSGLAFVGRAGQLLTRMIAAMGLTREQVFICNVLKCRPPENRAPAADEIIACSPYLLEQLTLIAPEVIVALGSPAAKTLLSTNESIGQLRGRFHDFYLSGPLRSGAAIPLMPTYHPAYLLRTPGDKYKVWDDLKRVMAKLELPLPTP